MLMLANWPYTMFAIMPTNTALMAMDPAFAEGKSRPMIESGGGCMRDAARSGCWRSYRFFGH